MEAKERNSTADEIVSYLSDKFCVFAQGEKKYTDKEKKDYGLPQQFEKSDLLDILNIRYALSLQAYQKYLSVTVAKDVSDETVAAIMENQYDISGVDIKQDTIRVYEGGEACSSILGYTGTISSEELKERDDSKLTINSIVGKSGMEQYLDQVLQGTDGKKEVYVDNTGRTTQDLGVIQQPRAGKDVYLSIDVELQKKTYEALERKIADILVQHLINTKTFDKKGIDDTTEIKIPIYDVYIALLNNGVIDLEQLREEDASELERKFFQIFLKKKSEVVQGIEKDLRELSTKYNELGIENQEYQSFIIENLNIINNKNNNEELVEKWEKGELSMKEYLYDQIGVGNATYDKIAIWGNRDCGGGAARQYENIMQQSGFTVLKNENWYVTTDSDKKILFTGLDDSMLGNVYMPDSTKIYDSNYNILLIHEPDTADSFQEYPYDLVLSGHSHGGQVNIPFIPAINQKAISSTNLAKNYVSGMYELNSKTKIYVNTGIGTTHVSGRLGVVPEISIFHIYL